MGDSYLSNDYGEGSVLSGEYEGEDRLMSSMLEDEDADDEDEDDEDGGGEAPAARSDAQAPEKPEISKQRSPRVAVQDVNAELMTGIPNLTLEKEVAADGEKTD